MPEKTQQTAGDGVKQPVIPQQNQEPAIEIIEDDAAQAVKPVQEFPHDATDKDRVGSYEYDQEDGEQKSDARTGHAQQGGEAQAADGETQEQLTARQRRRRRENAARDRERQELQRLRAENAQLKHGQQRIDTRLSAIEQAGIDGQIANLESEVTRANMVMKRAMEAQNPDDFIQAQEIRDAFRDQLAKLRTQKEHAAKAEKAPQQQAPTTSEGMTQAQVHFARIFTGRHPWFNPNLNVRDRDSDMVRQLDGEMLAEGLNPSTPEYWVELERRIQEDMPHRNQQAANEGGVQPNGGQAPQQGATRGNGASRGQGGPKLPGSGAGGSGAGGGVVKFHLSAARKQAMIDSGNWDDPVRRERQIRYFMKWDADQAAQK